MPSPKVTYLIARGQRVSQLTSGFVMKECDAEGVEYTLAIMTENGNRHFQRRETYVTNPGSAAKRADPGLFDLSLSATGN